MIRLKQHVVILPVVVLIVLFAAQPGTGECAPSAKRSFPLIIMGGHWSAAQRPEYSNLSRICDTGFTHIFSYYTAPMLTTDISVIGAVKIAEEFATLVKDRCPSLGLVLGVPRRWIYEGRVNDIESYAETISDKRISVDYWMSDEMIHEMTQKGMSLEDATHRAQSELKALKKYSAAPYVWIEPGNYNKRLSKILDVLNDLPADIKAYDEYVVSRSGRLSRSQINFMGLVNTLKRLKSGGNAVFPVCEINFRGKKELSPTEEELATIAIALLLEGADGLIFYEERWTTHEILQSMKKIFKIVNYLNEVGIDQFVRTDNEITTWEVHQEAGTVKVLLNKTTSRLNVDKYVPRNATIIWPPKNSKRELQPMELMVYRFK